MTRFINGPAHGQNLMLRRAPVFLRVTDDGTKFDALDQHDDNPEPNERIYCYVMTQYLGGTHLLIRGKNRAAGGFYASAEYTFIEEQPTDEEMRDNARWRRWTEENRKLIPPEIAERAKV
jgi:hypothetical protein